MPAGWTARGAAERQAIGNGPAHRQAPCRSWSLPGSHPSDSTGRQPCEQRHAFCFICGPGRRCLMRGTPHKPRQRPMRTAAAVRRWSVVRRWSSRITFGGARGQHGQNTYVGNLPYTDFRGSAPELFTVRERSTMFASCATWRPAAHAGFAFVEMTTDEEAQKAITTSRVPARGRGWSQRGAAEA